MPTKTNHTVDDRLIDHEAARLKAETAKLLAEAKEAQANAKGAEAGAKMAHLAAEEADREAQERKALDGNNHIYRFMNPVSAMSSQHCQSTLAMWSRLDPECDIEIVFNSPGGSVIDGMALFDFITGLRAAGHRITTVARGYAASMAGILLQAGDHRVIGRESYLMIHEISAGTGGKIGEIQDAVKFYERICERVVDIFVDRSKDAEGKPRCSKATFTKNWKRIDWWLDSAEALKYGFVDEIR